MIIIIIEYYTLKADQPIYRIAYAHTVIYVIKTTGKKESRK